VAYDVFISYASKDKVVADAVCARLEAAGIRCWIAPRDIVPGTSYGEAIIEAIHVTKVMVLVFSSNANSSGHIPKEVERAVSNSLTILPFRIEDVAPGKSLDYFIGSVHWLDAMTPPMEQHLDSLAATVRKLLPVRAGEQGVPAAPTSGVWQRSAAPAMQASAPSVAPAVISAPPTNVGRAPSSSSKTLWIGVAALIVIAVLVMGWMRMRGAGGSTENTGDNTGLNAVAPPTSPSSPISPEASASSPSKGSTGNPIVGCYQWFNNAAVVIHGDGTMVAGPFAARWRETNASARAYTFTWPEAVDTVTVAPNQQTLAGGNQYGYPTSGTRISGGSGLLGVWRWPNGVPVIVNADGTCSAGPLRCRWRTQDSSRGLYTLTWPSPVDSVRLSANGSRIAGGNQYGVAISGVRTGACAEN
jgi:hypothetical protein